MVFTLLFGPLLLLFWGLLLSFPLTRLYASAFLGLVLLRLLWGLTFTKTPVFPTDKLEYTVDGDVDDSGGGGPSNALRETRSASKAKAAKSKPTIFFIHGWPDNSSVWDKQVAAFSKDYRCVRVNLPHYGGSSGHPAMGYSFDSLVTLLASTLHASLDCQPETSAYLMIHDWGSWYGMQLQRRYPRLVKKVRECEE
jgi:pimeloyl-ACP methyl ester carboxylesterase